MFGTKKSLNFDIRDVNFENAFNYTDNALNIFNNLSADANGNESLTIEGQHSSGIVGSGARIGFKQTDSASYGAYIKSYTFGAGNTGLGFATVPLNPSCLLILVNHRAPTGEEKVIYIFLAFNIIGGSHRTGN